MNKGKITARERYRAKKQFLKSAELGSSPTSKQPAHEPNLLKY